MMNWKFQKTQSLSRSGPSVTHANGEVHDYELNSKGRIVRETISYPHGIKVVREFNEEGIVSAEIHHIRLYDEPS